MGIQKHVPIIAMQAAGEVRRRHWVKNQPDTYGAKAVIHDENNVLLVRNTYGNPKNWRKPNETWDFPGGGLDDLNKMEARVLLAAGVALDNFPPGIFIDTVIREIDEELSYSAEPGGMRHIGNVLSEELSIDHIGLFAVPVTNLAKIEFVPQRNEIHEIKPFPISELPDNRREYISSVVGQLMSVA